MTPLIGFVLGVGILAVCTIAFTILVIIHYAQPYDPQLFGPATSGSPTPVQSPDLVVYTSPRGRAFSSTKSRELY